MEHFAIGVTLFHLRVTRRAYYYCWESMQLLVETAVLEHVATVATLSDLRVMRWACYHCWEWM